MSRPKTARSQMKIRLAPFSDETRQRFAETVARILAAQVVGDLLAAERNEAAVAERWHLSGPTDDTGDAKRGNQ